MHIKTVGLWGPKGTLCACRTPLACPAFFAVSVAGS